MKKLIIVLCLLLAIPFSAQAGVRETLTAELGGEQFFPDVATDHHNFLSIAWMGDEGTVEGYPDGTFKPDNPVNRAELMKMVVLMHDDVELGPSYGNCFPDVTDSYHDQLSNGT